MNRRDVIYVAGHTGLLGSAIVRHLRLNGYERILTPSREELDLRDQASVRRFFETHKPDYVFLAAAVVGSITKNINAPGTMIYENLMIESNVIEAARQCGAKKLLFIGSNCMYPKHCSQPMKETDLMTGTLEPTNEPFAIAKLAGLSLCQSHNRQYNTNFIGIILASLYGPGDHFNDDRGHVISALISKIHAAKVNNAPHITLLGTGNPRREFIYVDDAAQACIRLMEDYDPTVHDKNAGTIFFNAGYGSDMQIKDIAFLLSNIIQWDGHVEWDIDKPDGMFQKLLDSTSIHQVTKWHTTVPLVKGLMQTYEWFVANHVEASGD